jgi:hypothetical protein
VGIGVAAIEFDLIPELTPLFVVACVVGYFGAIAVHEVGHAVAAKALRFRILIFAIWPLIANRRKRGWRISRFRGTRLGGFVGVYPNGTDSLRWRFLGMVAGGPGASLLAAALALVAIWQFRLAPWPHEALAVFAAMSGLTGLMSLIPATITAAMSDGARILLLLRGGAEADRILSVLLLTTASMAGMRPREWDRALVESGASRLGGGPDAILGNAFRYIYLVDTGEVASAGEVLNWLLDFDFPAPARESWCLQAACFNARRARDLESAKAWFEAAPKIGRTPEIRCIRLQAEAGIALLESRLEAARQAATEALAECDRLGDSGSLVLVRESLRDLIAEAGG